MTPDIDVQLGAVLRALKGTVLQALDPQNSSAQEQLRVSISTLELIRTQRPYEVRVAREELRAAIALANSAYEVTRDSHLTDATEQANDLLSRSEFDSSQLNASKAELLRLVSALVNDPKAVWRAELARTVVLGSSAQLNLARTWFLNAGFEPVQADVATLAESLPSERTSPSATAKERK
jgi:hypothetical protein